jgi:hypothetical protein
VTTLLNWRSSTSSMSVPKFASPVTNEIRFCGERGLVLDGLGCHRLELL